MKQFFTIIALLIVSLVNAQSTRKIIKDFDGDKWIDTVFIDSEAKKLFSVLSSNNYQRVSSFKIRSLNFGNTLVDTKDGFEFWNDYDRSGWINTFTYNPKEKKMQLIKISRTDYDLSSTTYGEAVREGSGKSSINLLTNTYIGDFYYFKNDKLNKLPTIKATMVFTDTYLYCFSDQINFDFEKQCVELYEKAKKEQ